MQNRTKNVIPEVIAATTCDVCSVLFSLVTSVTCFVKSTILVIMKQFKVPHFIAPFHSFHSIKGSLQSHLPPGLDLLLCHFSGALSDQLSGEHT